MPDERIITVEVAEELTDVEEVALRVGEEEVDVARVQTDGRAVVRIPPEVGEGPVYIETCEGAVEVDLDLLQGQRVLLTREVVGRSDAYQLSSKPNTVRHEGLVKPRDVTRHPERVGLVPASSMPSNRVLQRFTARYFEVEEADLHARGSEWVAGRALDYEISWEPAGWALDEWVHTSALAPYEDRAESSSSVRATAGSRRAEELTDEQRSRLSELGSSSAEEAMAIAASAQSTSRGVDLGFGQGQSKSSTITIDPVLALTQAVTGAFQFGFNASKATATADQQADLHRSITQRVERATGQLRAAAAAAALDSATEVTDVRSLHALRNLAAGTTLNLATFSVCRQWRLATLVTDYRPVVFIPIDRVDERFTARDVFLHRSVLADALLDESLRGALEDVAQRWQGEEAVSAAAAAPPQAEIRAVEGEVEFSDRAGGRGSRVRITLSFRTDDGRPDDLHTEVLDTTPGRRQRFRIETNRPLSRYGGAVLRFANPGAVYDEVATVSSLRLDAVLSDGRRTPLHASDGAIRLRDNEDHPLPRRDPLVPPSESVGSAPADRTLIRLLDHLDHHRVYYRLAIDLRIDSVSRFTRLKERLTGAGAAAAPLMPIDLRPIGVVAAHLAFAVDPGENPVTHEQRKDKGVGGKRDYQLVSTPTSAVFVEAIPGGYAVPGAADSERPRLPSGPKDQNVSYPWPERNALPTSTIDALLAKEGAAAPTGSAPAVPESVLKELLDASALLTFLKGLAADSATAASAAKDAATPSATGDDTKDGKSGGGTTDGGTTDDGQTEGGKTDDGATKPPG